MFGQPKRLNRKNINLIKISIHPNFFGIYLCYLNLLNSLSTDLEIFNRPREVHVWKMPQTDGYVLMNNINWYMYYTMQNIQDVTLLVYNSPDLSKAELQLLHQDASIELIQFLKSTKHDIQKVNPTKLQHLINKHLSPQIILDLNKNLSSKPHRQMSFDLLAQLLSSNRNQLNHRVRVLNQERKTVLDQLSQESSCVRELLNIPNTYISPEKIWS